MRLILSISILILSMSGFVHADVLKLIGEDTVKADTATVTNTDAVKEKKGIEVDKRHHVIKGDTLWDLAMKYYADPFKWGIIYNANIDYIKNPDLIYPEEGFLIPGIKEKIVPEKPIAKIVDIHEVKIAEIREEFVPTIPMIEIEEEVIIEVKKPKKFKIPEFSEKMPKDQMEWNTMLETDLVDKNWSGEGLVIGKQDKQEEDSLAFGGWER